MKKIAILFSLFIILVVGKTTLAAEIFFFEFAPDISTPFKVSSGETPYQLFQPNNEFISGFDIWIDNAGTTGTASFSLYDNMDNFLVKKTLTVPTISPRWGGQRFRVDFGLQLAVSSTAVYKIKFVSSLPELRVYYADKIQLLSFNAPFPPEQVLKSVYLGTTKQDFIFKLALYENQETSPPIISNVTSTIIFPDKIKLKFNANEPVDFKLAFGPENEGYTQNTDFSGNYEFCSEGINICSLTVDVLSGINYNYQLFSRDQWENETQIDGSFFIPNELSPQVSTSSPPEIIEENPPDLPPIISDAEIISITSSSVTIAWKTNEAANSRLVISLDSLGSQIVTTANDSVFELEHLMTSGDNLSPKTNYFASVISSDPAGNPTSKLISFATLSESDNEPSPISSIPQLSPQIKETVAETPETATIPPAIIIITIANNQTGGATTVIRWEAPLNGEPESGYRIDIFDQNYTLQKQIFIESGIHEAVLVNLPAGKYYLIVYANYNGVFKKIAEQITDFIIPESSPESSFLKKITFDWVFNLSIAFALFIVFAVGSIFAFILVKKYKLKNGLDENNNSGFTLVEIIIGIAIVIAISLISGVFIQFISRLGIFPAIGFENQQELQETFQLMTPELRSMEVSNNGSYPIENASTSSLIFYSDIDKDGLVERIRYFKDGVAFKKAVIKPAGNPLIYNPAEEKTFIAIHKIIASSSDIFSYYDEDYTGSEAKISFPVNIQQIRTIKTEIIVEQGSGLEPMPTTLSIQATPRNLR